MRKLTEKYRANLERLERFHNIGVDWNNPPAFAHTEPTIDQILSGYVQIDFYVNGYWSDVLNIYIDRAIDFSSKERKPYWQIRFSVSSGGTEGDLSNLERFDCYAEAVQEMNLYGKLLMNRVEEFEAMYKANDKLQSELRKAALNADPAVGNDRAKDLVKIAYDEAKKGSGSRIFFRDRARTEWKAFYCDNLGGRVKWTNEFDNVCSMKSVIDKLSRASHTAYIPLDGESLIEKNEVA